MSEALLATVAELAAYLKTTIPDGDASATLYLQIASGMVRDQLRLQGYSVDSHTNEAVLVDPIDGAYLFLNGLPIQSVSLVETFDGTVWSTAAASTYTVSKRLGIIAALPGLGIRWPTNPETWRVTYSHGFTALPGSVQGVVLSVAARGYTTEPGIDSERIGGYQVKYSMESAGFSAIEKVALAQYNNPRIA